LPSGKDSSTLVHQQKRSIAFDCEHYGCLFAAIEMFQRWGRSTSQALPSLTRLAAAQSSRVPQPALWDEKALCRLPAESIQALRIEAELRQHRRESDS
jgi:hypothetical protein